MSRIGKLLGMIVIGNQASRISFSQRLLSGLATVVGLALVVAILCGALLVGGIYVLYRTLVLNGLDPQIALLVVGGVLIILTGILIFALISYLQKIRSIPGQLMDIQAPLTSRVTGIADAFIDGLLTHKPRRRY